MQKSPTAFRTISEVSEVLGIRAHVLRFWESKFTQIKPVKRGGGRRYYRPEDIGLIRSIQHLLHEQGMTIKGAQKVLRERGVKAIIAMGQDLLDDGPASETVKTAMSEELVSPVLKPAIEVPAPRDPQLETIYLRLQTMRKSVENRIAELA